MRFCFKFPNNDLRIAMGTSEKPIESRVDSLESALAFLQHDLEAQNETILLQTKQIARLEGSIQKLASELEAIKIGKDEKSDPLDEKPPH